MKEIKSLQDIVGLEVASIEGGKVGDEEITFNFSDGNVVKMLHQQDCCETVVINDIDGDIQDLVGGVVTQFDEASSQGEDYKGDEKPNEFSESWTWTFYNIATTKGFVNIRWLGESNGFYSESVDICVKTENDDDWCPELGDGWKDIT